MKLAKWLNDRLPVADFLQRHLAQYYVPKNFNFWYMFGAFAMFILFSQILTGIFLTMYYMPSANEAFDSIEIMMREVQYGWLIRYLHSTGASAFFIVIYLHIYKAIMYGSYKKPRELLWLLGVILFIVLMAESYTGYVLPWGQMSFWAAKVIVSLFSTVPIIGEQLVIWIQGDYNISGVILHRFFSYHVIAVPLILLGFVAAHICALHTVGSNNPEGIEISNSLDKDGVPLDGIPFHPFFTLKDYAGLLVFLVFFFMVVFYAPTLGGYFLEAENFKRANPLVTPNRIMPSWYLSPFYAILRAVPHKGLGAVAMVSAIFILFFLPWLDKSKVKSIRYKGVLSKIALATLVISFIALGVLGSMPTNDYYISWARFFSISYFAVFLLMPFYTSFEKAKRVPKRINI